MAQEDPKAQGEEDSGNHGLQDPLLDSWGPTARAYSSGISRNANIDFCIRRPRPEVAAGITRHEQLSKFRFDIGSCTICRLRKPWKASYGVDEVFSGIHEALSKVYARTSVVLLCTCCVQYRRIAVCSTDVGKEHPAAPDGVHKVV